MLDFNCIISRYRTICISMWEIIYYRQSFHNLVAQFIYPSLSTIKNSSCQSCFSTFTNSQISYNNTSETN